MQTQQRVSNGAESVEAKQDSAGAQQAAEKAARNEDAESVEAKEGRQAAGSAGSDESDEEGEITGGIGRALWLARFTFTHGPAACTRLFASLDLLSGLDTLRQHDSCVANMLDSGT